MVDMEKVENTIERLTNTADNLEDYKKLAALFIVKDHIQERKSKTEIELDDILPQYKIYVEAKRRYQRGEGTDDAVIQTFKGLCKEITEFIQSLYASSDMAKERRQINNMITDIYETITK